MDNTVRRPARGPRLTNSKAFLLNALFAALCAGGLAFMAFNYHSLSSMFVDVLAQNEKLESVHDVRYSIFHLAVVKLADSVDERQYQAFAIQTAEAQAMRRRR